MSRDILAKGPRVWRLFCNVRGCGFVSAESWPAQPPLEVVRDLGWWVGTLVDACPKCVAAGRLPQDEPYDFEAAAARRTARAVTA